MRFIPYCLLFIIPSFLNAQKMAIGTYVTPAINNIVYKSDHYDPIFTIGGGLNFNYYKNRWFFSTGLSFKIAGGSQNIPVTTVSQPEGDGTFAKSFSRMYVLAIPLGVNYAFLNKENFRLFGGLTIENGYVLNKQMIVTNKEFSYKMKRELEKGYYLGIMPEIRMECNLSPKIFLFSKMGLSYQLNFLKLKPPVASIPEWVEKFKINNLFIDIGFGYRLKN